jgi:hypothetical protein
MGGYSWLGRGICAQAEVWVAKLATSLLVTASSLGLNPDIPQKTKIKEKSK